MTKKILLVIFAIAGIGAIVRAQDIWGKVVGSSDKPAIAITDFRGAGDAAPFMNAFNQTLYADIDAGLDRWCKTFSTRYVELLSGRDTSDWRAPAHAAATLSRVDLRALMTGNPERVARARMERLGLADLFPNGQGAFGCERERRVALFELACERAGNWPARDTVAVGDTPLDIQTAQSAGGRCVAVATGRYARNDLVEADAVISALDELPDALARLATVD